MAKPSSTDTVLENPMTATTPHLRLVPASQPVDRWIAAVNRTIDPIEQFASASSRRRRATPRTVIAWIAAVRREDAA